MYKLKTVSYKTCKDNKTLKGFPEISAKLIENSAEYKIYIKMYNLDIKKLKISNI